MRRNANITNTHISPMLLVWLIIVSIFAFSLVRNLFDLMGMQSRLHLYESQTVSLKQENERLSMLSDNINKGQLDNVLIRDRLGLYQPGEVVVILPSELVETPLTNSNTTLHPSVPTQDLMYWQQWLMLFL